MFHLINNGKGYELMNKMMAQVKELNCQVINENVSDVDLNIYPYKVTLTNNEVYLNPCTQSIFAWHSIKDKKILRFNFGFGELDKCCIMVNHKTKYELFIQHILFL